MMNQPYILLDKMKRILIIGAGWEQYALVEEVKKQGHMIIATHPTMNTDGFKFADTFFVKDSRDINSHLEIARNYNIDAVLTDNCDYSFFTAAVIAKALNLPFSPIQAAIYSNDKIAQRQACKNSNLVQPKFYSVETFEQIEGAAMKLGYPLIVKPIDSRGTFGVSIVQSSESLLYAFIDAIINSPSRRIICEEFISGTLVTVDGFCFKNGHKSLTIASRVFEDGAKPITKEIIYPARFGSQLNGRLLENHHRVVNALGYKYGHTHGEYLITDNQEIFLVECANRGGGVYTSSTIVPNLTDINLNEILINQSLGTDNFHIAEQENGYMKKSMLLTFLDFEVGKVIKSINMNELKNLPYVVKYRSYYKENDMVESIENCATRHSMLVIEGKTVEETYQNHIDFKQKMNIEYYHL